MQPAKFDIGTNCNVASSLFYLPYKTDIYYYVVQEKKHFFSSCIHQSTTSLHRQIPLSLAWVQIITTKRVYKHIPTQLLLTIKQGSPLKYICLSKHRALIYLVSACILQWPRLSAWWILRALNVWMAKSKSPWRPFTDDQFAIITIQWTSLALPHQSNNK